MILVFTAQAEGELERIGDHIAVDNPRRALSFVQELRTHALCIAQAPMSYPLVLGFEPGGIRRCIHGNYLIFFRVTAQSVEIIHILHGAMNYEELLFPYRPGRPDEPDR